jgi:hypothetical protein
MKKTLFFLKCCFFRKLPNGKNKKQKTENPERCGGRMVQGIIFLHALFRPQT